MSELELDEAPPGVVVTAVNPPDVSKLNAVSKWRDDQTPISGIRVGVMVGIKDEGRTPLVIFPGQRDSAAVPARATLDLHGAHVGCEVVLMFEDGDPQQPVILGCLPRKEGCMALDRAGQVEVDVDGERLIVTAKDQLVLRCGKATITLTKAGKILIHGTYISSRSSGVNRIKGGSIQLN